MIGSSPCPARSARLGTRGGGPAGQHAACERSLGPQPGAHGVLGLRAGDAHHTQPGGLLEQHQQRARVDQGPAALDDQLEHAVQVGLKPDGSRDSGGRLEPPHGPLELAAAPLHVLIETCVVDRDGRPLGQDDHELLVAPP